MSSIPNIFMIFYIVDSIEQYCYDGHEMLTMVHLNPTLIYGLYIMNAPNQLDLYNLRPQNFTIYWHLNSLAINIYHPGQNVAS